MIPLIGASVYIQTPRRRVPAIWMEAALTSTRASPDAICTTGAAQFEVDFILGDHTAIEVKAKGLLRERFIWRAQGSLGGEARTQPQK